MLHDKKRIPVIKSVCAALFLCMLTGCGGSDSADGGIMLIDEMAQIDFDIDYPVGQITKEVTVTQDFISNANVLKQIWLYGATYMRENTATIQVRLYHGDTPGEADTVMLAEWTIDSSTMEDNSIIKLDVPESEKNTGLSGEHCLIEISSPDGEPDLSPTFWMTEEDVYPDGHLGISGYEQYNDLWFQVVGE